MSLSPHRRARGGSRSRWFRQAINKKRIAMQSSATPNNRIVQDLSVGRGPLTFQPCWYLQVPFRGALQRARGGGMSCLRGVIFLGNGTNDEHDFELFLVEFFVPAPDGGVTEVLWYRSLSVPLSLFCGAVVLCAVLPPVACSTVDFLEDCSSCSRPFRSRLRRPSTVYSRVWWCCHLL